jgi:Domain of unknown function (DUF6457)
MNPLDDWIAHLASELDVDVRAVDRDKVLGVARDAAHAIARPAAPLTTYLVGLAAGLRGGSADAARQAAEIAQQLVARRGASPGEDSAHTPAPGATDRSA